ncbi:MAG: GNAT family N-acetyltransferase [Chitinophagaceae bacterium]|nr:GNAT family N-acetyltransferase [Chitinophagaceae bacterium]
MGKVNTGSFDIETHRLRLICCTKEILEALFKGDEALAELLEISIPVKWTEFGEPVFRFTYNNITKGKGHIQWWTYLPVLKKTGTLLGSCGYKGDPGNGMVEIGYEVAEAYRGFGLATEMAKALIKRAFESNEVEYVRAHTLAAENESGSVLKNCGMQKMEELDDPQDGKVWRWEIRKQKSV